MTDTDLRTKIVAVADALKAAFYEREREIDGLIVALLARQHVLLLGTPGTAKSALANAVCQALGEARFFERLLTRFSTPEEIFGPVAFSALKEDRYTRVTTGKLPECHVAFIDECFKANSAILNSLLKAINERRFDNGAGAVDIPLETMVGASNELPEGGPTGELAPFFDRFLLRYWVEPLRSDASFMDLICDEDAVGAATPREPVVAGGMLTLAELKAAQAEVDAVLMPRGAGEALAQLRRDLGKLGIAPSDRRWKQAVKALRANAWLSGDSQVTEDHFGILADCLWDEPEQRRDLAAAVQTYCGQAVADAVAVHDALVDLIRALPPSGDSRLTAAGRVVREGKRALEQLATAATGASSASTQATIAKLRSGLEAELQPLRQEVQKGLGL